jgi:hypothetical protein
MSNREVIEELRDTATWVYAGFASQKVIDLLNRAADALEEADSEAPAAAWDEGWLAGDQNGNGHYFGQEENPYRVGDSLGESDRG